MSLFRKKTKQDSQEINEGRSRREAVNLATGERIIGNWTEEEWKAQQGAFAEDNRTVLLRRNRTNNAPKSSLLRRLKDIVFFSAIIIVVLVVAIIAGYVFFNWRGHSFQVTSYSIAQIIRETPIQLITNSNTTNIYCTIEDLPESKYNWVLNILGNSEGIIITKVKYAFGLDLKEDLNESNILVGSDDITITIPEPKLLYNEPDLDYKVVTKKTVLRAIVDKLTSFDTERELRIVFQQNMERFAEENGLKPTKEEIIRNIEPYFNKILGEKTRKRIIFK